MGAKKGKKGKKGAKKKEEAPAEPSEFAAMDLPTLKETIAAMRVKLDKVAMDRNYVQLERDTISNFFDITRQEVRDLESQVLAKDRLMEELERNHRVEVRVYMQKVKHLEYEHKNNLRKVETKGEGHLTEERDEHVAREHSLKAEKRSLKMELRELELAYEQEIRGMQENHGKQLAKLRQTFEKQLQDLQGRLEDKVEQLRADMELRRKVEVHEMEERKHLHIAELVQKHELAFKDIKQYYNVITRENVQLIRDLKAQLEEMREKKVKNEALMYEIAQENRSLKEPLQEAVAEVGTLRGRLKDYEKDKLVLGNARSRLVKLHDRQRRLQQEHKTLEMRFRGVQGERDSLYDSFEGAVREVQRRSNVRNLLLERRLGEAHEEFEKKQAQFAEALRAGNLDPTLFATVTRKLDEVLDQRNAMISDLKYQIARVIKAHNDTARAYAGKLQQLGIAAEEVQVKVPAADLLPAPLGLAAGPADLVVKPLASTMR